jgi:hypothetical protein
MPTADALLEILGDAAPPLTTKKSKNKVAAQAQALAQDTTSDEEWFEIHCGAKGRMFTKSAKYKADAILYRYCSAGRYAFRAACKKVIAKAKKDGPVGPLYYKFSRFISLSHPRDWYICGACRGTGDSPQGGQCEKCYGACYVVTTENYL